MKSHEELFDEAWAGIVALRSAVKLGIKIGREEKERLVLAEEIDRLNQKLKQMQEK